MVIYQEEILTPVEELALLALVKMMTPIDTRRLSHHIGRRVSTPMLEKLARTGLARGFEGSWEATENGRTVAHRIANHQVGLA